MDMVSGAPEQLIVLSRATYLPLFTAFATAAAVLAMLFHFYLGALAMTVLTISLFVSAGQRAGLARDYGPMPIGHGVSVPPHTEAADPPPWLALIWTLVADGTLFTSLVFGTHSISGFPHRIGRPRWHWSPVARSPSSPSRLSPSPRRRHADHCAP